MAKPQLHTACDDCVSILQDAASLLASESIEEPLMTLFHTRYQSRLAANVSSAKCHMCALLYTHLPQLREPFDNPREVLAFAISRARHDPRATTVGLIGFDEEAVDRQTHYLGSLRVQSVAHGHVRVLDSPRTWSLETLNHIRYWLKGCTSSHDDCTKLKKAAGRLPLRLIDVMSIGTVHVRPMEEIGPEQFNLLSLENLHNVRIASTDSLPPDTPYLTLSHRWGSPPSILLSKKTSFLLTDDISPHLLNYGETAVFQHAIHLTRALGFRYIWIDALCIMQDDGPEKTTEIMHMDDIYSNSMLNIAATEAKSREGLVFDRDILCTNPCRATVKIPDTQQNVRLQAFHEAWFLRPWEGPLNKRGWVFQERTLAPRIVHFTKDQVFWECRCLEASEVLPQGVPRGPPPTTTDPNDSSRTNSASSDIIQKAKAKWYDLVEGYSHTSLSFVDDHLLAISAIAKRLCSETRRDPSDYLAGMWKDDLPQSMLWSETPLPGRTEPTSIQGEMKHAPSWSWASIMAPVSTVEFSSLVATTEVVSVEVARISPNVFDGTHSCLLRLRGPVCKFRRHLRDGVPWIQVGQDKTEFQEFHDFDFQKGRAILIYWDTSRSATAAADEFFFLLHIASEHSEDGLIERGIILRRTAECGTYARVGSFFIPFKSEYPGSELEDAFKGHLSTLDTADYVEFGSDGKYTIDII